MLQQIQLQNFRNYRNRKFDFRSQSTLVVGPNAIGKTNILEAIYLLATGKSFRAEQEREVVKEGETVARVTGNLISVQGETFHMAQGQDELEIDWDNRERFRKLYKVNGVGKRQVDFVGNLRAVLFSPLDMEIVVDSPSIRRRYLDLVLSQVYKDYRLSAHIYDRALRQRNHLLYRIREDNLQLTTYNSQLGYWNNLLIENGAVIHQRRKEFLNFLSDLGNTGKEIFPVTLHYDHSIISEERLQKYSSEEIGAAATLVGPHRDDFQILESREHRGERIGRNVKTHGSRGEQRLAVFAIKIGELAFVKEATGEEPLLLLDDIFSELDPDNRHHILEVIPHQQTIMTTTDLHLVDRRYIKNAEIVEL